MRLHVKHQTRCGGFASELRASLQDIYLNTEARPTRCGQGIKTDKSGINRLHLVPNYGVVINISREYLWKKKRRKKEAVSVHFRALELQFQWRQIPEVLQSVNFFLWTNEFAPAATAACTENSSGKLSLYGVPTGKFNIRFTKLSHDTDTRAASPTCAVRADIACLAPSSGLSSSCCSVWILVTVTLACPVIYNLWRPRPHTTSRTGLPNEPGSYPDWY